MLRDYFNSLNHYKNGELPRNHIGTSDVRVKKIILTNAILCISSRMLIEYIEGKNDSSGVWEGYVYAGSMLVAAVLQSIVLHQYFHTMFTLGMRMRSAIIGLVYEKVSDKKNKGVFVYYHVAGVFTTGWQHGILVLVAVSSS